jgi:SAM-dependent methyltransferase
VLKSSLNRGLLLAPTLLLSAFLLFCFQPMVGKMVLPFLGGSASVWTTAVLFFQLMLLAGYFYADRVARIRNLRVQMIVHLVLMAAAALFLPVRFSGASLSPDDYRHPALWEFVSLLRSAGIPYFMVSTTAPLLQSWFSRTQDTSARDPYFLYAASNVGSLIALLAYPFFVEPALGVRDQSIYWFVGYVVLALLAAMSAGMLFRASAGPVYSSGFSVTALPPDNKTRAFWLAAAFVPSGLMLGVTTHISVNLTPMPLVWTLPLSVYLLTFILAFGRRIRVSSRRAAQLALPVLVLLCPAVGIKVPVVLGIDVVLIVVHMVLLFIGGLLCHTALAARRPDSRYLTQYYVWMALGGVLGGVFAAVAAPFLFTSIFEYPLLLAAAVYFREGSGRNQRLWATAVASLILGYAIYLPSRLGEKGNTVYVTRNFFGVKRVVDDGTERKLLHGDTLHGIQSLDPARAGETMIYYHREGPLGDVMEMMRDRPGQHIGVIGLGSGSIAAYAGPNRRVTFIEIDPDVETIAARFFTFLSRCGAQCNVVSGDGRLEIARFPDAEFDVLVLDAFSSDAIPPHLLSREAFDLYLSKLKPGGVLLFHVSNRYLKVKDLVAGLAAAANLPALVRDDRGTASKSHSIYVIAGRTKEAFGTLNTLSTWKLAVPPAGLRVWTDDYSNLLGLLQWEPEAR